MNNISILKNYILYILTFILVCMVGISGVFADTFENIGYLDDDSYVSVRVGYTSQQLNLTRTNQYQLSEVLEMYIEVENYNFQGGTTYAIEFYTASTPLKYVNSFGAYAETSSGEPMTCDTAGILSEDDQHLNFKFNCPKTVNYLKLNLVNASGNYIMDTGLFSWNYVYLKKVISSTGNEIIESQNAQIIQGQKDIINNQTQNTQDIINNQNANTQQQIESQKVCTTQIIDETSIVTFGKSLSSNGSLQEANVTGITDYYQISGFIKNIKPSRSSGSYNCYYDENKVLISCFVNNSVSINEILTPPNNAKYIRFSIDSYNKYPIYQIETCKNGNQALNDSITDLNDSLNDSDVDNSDALDFFNNFTDNTHGLSGIISAPLNAINSMLNNQCSPLTATWRGKTISLDCGYNFWSRLTGFKEFLNIALDGLLCYRILLKMFKLIEKLKNPEDDRVEVMDL